MPNPKILCIAALDSSGGAGLNQDIRVLTLLAEELLCVCTGITIQDYSGVLAIYPTADNVLEAQLQNILANHEIQYIKLGAICSVGQIRILNRCFASHRGIRVIIDPVLKPSKGLSFIPQHAIPQYLKLLTVGDFLCPNYLELQALTGIAISGFAEAVDAAQRLVRLYDLGVLVKGGHGDTKDIHEAFVASAGVHSFSHERYKWDYSHGTGCALSSAFTSFLLQGYDPPLAFEKASIWVAALYNKLNRQ
ncbi:MAG: hydroxymethylpyrimidine/phosphomethylpyrimidine kinase [Candidatus Cloacimonadaceae bacterium]|nr:hydroxymethylpyrimidine/phosphomethylpyrimidine kinase [Candidatus Cloacimonadaceae bacterium]